MSSESNSQSYCLRLLINRRSGQTSKEEKCITTCLSLPLTSLSIFHLNIQIRRNNLAYQLTITQSYVPFHRCIMRNCAHKQNMFVLARPLTFLTSAAITRRVGMLHATAIGVLPSWLRMLSLAPRFIRTSITYKIYHHKRPVCPLNKRRVL